MNISRASSTTVLPALALLTCFGEALGAEVATYRGRVFLDHNGMPQFVECGTNRSIPFAPMTPTATAKFIQSYDEISRNGKVSIVAEITDEFLARGLPTGPLRSGACEGTPHTTEDPMALTRLLKELREKLDRFRVIPRGEVPYDFSTQLADLIGATRSQIQTALGMADFCDTEDASYECPKTDKLAYFFCSKDPLAFGGCFGLELEFNASDKLTFAKWQGYR